jgi:O-antigen ligase
MSARTPAAAGSPVLPVTILALLVGSPLVLGATARPVVVLLAGCFVVGIWAWARGRRSGSDARAPLPGRGLLLALHALVLLQLVPMPPAVLRLVSPGSFSFYNERLLVPPLTQWKPISVSPPDTVRGLVFLAAFSLLYLAVFREMGQGRWRRRLMLAVVATGVFITVVALLQAVSADPRKIYGVWRPPTDWAVFGPYVNRSHFAGYLIMAASLALGMALEAFSRLRRVWSGRRRAWLALGEAEGASALRWGAIVMVMVAGLLASKSRGGVSAFAAAALCLPLVSQKRRRTALTVVALAGLAVAWVGIGGVVSAFEARGIQGSRLDLWRDMLPLVPRFPVFGVGWNAFAVVYPWYQTIWRTQQIAEAHNDYLQALIDGGVVGLFLVVALLFLVFRRALARARRDPLDLGLFGALLAFAVHEMVDFNGQIPPNAATFVALAALAVAGERRRDTLSRASLERSGPGS